MDSMRDRVNRLINVNQRQFGQDFSKLDRLAASGREAGQPRAEKPAEQQPSHSQSLFGMLDPYLEEQKSRMNELMEHQLEVVRMGQNETEKLLRDKVRAMDEANARLREDNFDLKKSLASAQNDANMLKVETDLVQQERSALMEELSKARQQLQSDEDVTTSQLLAKTREVIELKTTLSICQRDLEEQTQSGRQLSRQVTELEAELKEWGGYVRTDRGKKDEEIGNLRALYAEAVGESEEKARRLKAAQEELAQEREKSSRDVDELIKEKGRLGKDLSELRYQLESKTRDLQAQRELSDKPKLDRQHARIAELEADLEARDRQLRSLDGALQEKLRPLEEAAARKDKDLAHLKEDSDKLEARLREAQAELDRVREDRDLLKRDARRLEEDKQALEKKIRDAQALLEQERDQAADLRKKLARLEERPSQNPAQSQAARPPADLEADLDRLKRDLKDLGLKLEARQQDLEARTRELDKVTQRAADLEEKLRREEKRAEDLEAALRAGSTAPPKTDSAAPPKTDPEKPDAPQGISDQAKELMKRRDEKIKQLTQENKELNEALAKAGSGQPPADPTRKSEAPAKNQPTEEDKKLLTQIVDLQSRISQLEEENQQLRQKLKQAEAGKPATGANPQADAAGQKKSGWLW